MLFFMPIISSPLLRGNTWLYETADIVEQNGQRKKQLNWRIDTLKQTKVIKKNNMEQKKISMFTNVHLKKA